MSLKSIYGFGFLNYLPDVEIGISCQEQWWSLIMVKDRTPYWKTFLIIASLSSKMFSIHVWPELGVFRNQGDLENKVLTCPWTGFLESLALHTACSGCEPGGRLGTASWVHSWLVNIRRFVMFYWKTNWISFFHTLPSPLISVFSFMVSSYNPHPPKI